MIEAFWSRMQVELLDTRRWRTRVELANAIFEYIEIFYNRRRRHSSLGLLTPIEFELKNISTTPVATSVKKRGSTEPGAQRTCPRNRGHSRCSGAGEHALPRLPQGGPAEMGSQVVTAFSDTKSSSRTALGAPVARAR